MSEYYVLMKKSPTNGEIMFGAHKDLSIALNKATQLHRQFPSFRESVVRVVNAETREEMLKLDWVTINPALEHTP